MKQSYECIDCLFITDELSRKPNFCPECGHKGTAITTEEFERLINKGFTTGLTNERREQRNRAL